MCFPYSASSVPGPKSRSEDAVENHDRGDRTGARRAQGRDMGSTVSRANISNARRNVHFVSTHRVLDVRRASKDDMG